MIVAFMVDADAAHEVFVEVLTAGQGAAAEDGAMVFLSQDQSFEGIRILRLDGFADEFPNAVVACVCSEIR